MKVMIDKIYCFVLNKLSDCFPVIGGAGGAVSQVKKIEYLPTWEAIISAAIIAVVGAVLGYGVKLALDIALRKLKKRYDVK